MTALAPTLQAFFTDRLMTQRQASPHTVAAYRDTLRLLLRYAQHRTGKNPAELTFTDLDAPMIGAFLSHLETGRNNNITTRNTRLTAIHSLFRYAALHVPEHAALIARSSTATRSTPCSPHRTPRPGPDAATTHCCSSPSRPGCGYPN